MPVEIRELIIKTEIRTDAHKVVSTHEIDVSALREELQEMCKKLLSEGVRRTNYRR